MSDMTCGAFWPDGMWRCFHHTTPVECLRALAARAEAGERAIADGQAAYQSLNEAYAQAIIERDEARALVERERKCAEINARIRSGAIDAYVTARNASSAWKRLAKRYRWLTPADVASSNGYGAGLTEAAEQAEHLAEGHSASGAEIGKALRHFADEWTEGKPVDMIKDLRTRLAAAEADVAAVRKWGEARRAQVAAQESKRLIGVAWVEKRATDAQAAAADRADDAAWNAMVEKRNAVEALADRLAKP